VLDEAIHVFRLFLIELLAKFLMAFKLVCGRDKAFVIVVQGFADWGWVSEIGGG